MELTYLLVDFENHQPSAQEFARVRGDAYRVLIFHGPQQNRFDADVVQAWQPLGDKVQFIQCPKSGRNALDMHIAFHIGLIIEAHGKAGAAEQKAPRLVVISNDTDFDPLLQYLRSLNYAANRSATIRAAIGVGAGAAAAAGNGEVPDGKSAKAKTGRQSTARKAAPAKAAAPASAAPTAKPKKALPAKAPAAKAATAKAPAPKAAAKKAQPTATAAPSVQATAPDPIEKLIDHLRTHPKGRPSNRKALEKHIASVLRGRVAAESVPALISQLETRGVIALDGAKVGYPLWPAEAA
ncbi:MAG TPA: PIN domain-containing protein [Burkholderiaceae bacterium]|nr:PIN domain-containing protein [Burkholderiaceae bacterium]